MKTLLILRHGKAEAYNADGDHERNLTDRGVRDAGEMGKKIAKSFAEIDRVVSSDASRAAQTARLAAEHAGYTGAIDFRPEIYDATPEILLAVVQSFDESANTILLVGHNPGLSELFADLTGQSDQQSQLPTAGLVQIQLPDTWNETTKDIGREIKLWKPE